MLINFFIQMELIALKSIQFLHHLDFVINIVQQGKNQMEGYVQIKVPLYFEVITLWFLQ